MVDDGRTKYARHMSVIPAVILMIMMPILRILWPFGSVCVAQRSYLTPQNWLIASSRK